MVHERMPWRNMGSAMGTKKRSVPERKSRTPARPPGLGSAWTNLLRPAQKKIVARPMGVQGRAEREAEPWSSFR